MEKQYTIVTTLKRDGREPRVTRHTGGLEYLTEYFKYDLECGKAYERERGNKRINLAPQTIRSLVTNLNNAATNRSANGCVLYTYHLEI